jgi:hypothetical protein
VSGQGRSLLSGLATSIQGGDSGLGVSCSFDGHPGHGLVVSAGGIVHRSAITEHGGHTAYDCGYVEVTPIVGATIVDAPDSPSLSMTSDPIGNQNVTFTVTGVAGDSVRLRVGRQPVVVDLIDVLEDRLTLPLRTYDLGTMPASGSMQYTFHVPGSLAPGFLIVFQANAVALSGETRLSTSIPLIRR